jgi:hypothetical protein
MTHPHHDTIPARKCACGHFARIDEVTTCRFCDCTEHRGAVNGSHQGYDPQTPAGAETALQSFSDALDEARELLAAKRDLEVDALAALKEAKRRALLSDECPKVRRNECTVAERDAWAEDQAAGEEKAWMLAKADRQAAADHLHTVGKQGAFQQSIGASVRESYRGMPPSGGRR